MVCIRGSSEPRFSLQSGQTCKQRSAVPLLSPEEGENVDLGGMGRAELSLSQSCSPSKHPLAHFASLLTKK